MTEAVCVVQPVLGVAALGGSGLVWSALLVAIALNLLIWLVLIALLAVAAIGILSALIAGAFE